MLKNKIMIYCVASYMVPIVLIFISILLSNWFNPWYNALSDLGHVLKSSVAPIFNFGLVFGGFLIVLLATHYMYRYDRLKAVILVYSGFTLSLIGVYDEVYRILHFMVSVMFFISLIIYLLIRGIRTRSLYPILIVILQITIWILHLIYSIPPGAAIPELIAVFSFIPFYILDYLKISRNTLHKLHVDH